MYCNVKYGNMLLYENDLNTKLKETIMKADNYLGDYRLSHRVVYSKNTYTECIYCGKKADTREHVPSKVFLLEPLPENLPTLPACLECNNSYSHDELIVSILVQLLKKKHYGANYEFSETVKKRLIKERNIDLVKKLNDIIDKNEFSTLDKEINRVLTKLAIGHSVWEISEGYFTGGGRETSESVHVEYRTIDNMSEDEINDFLQYFIITNELLPELGSRAYNERILVMEINGKPSHIILDWVEVQDAEYMYTCYRFGNEILVKMLINNYLFAKVTINLEDL